MTAKHDVDESADLWEPALWEIPGTWEYVEFAKAFEVVSTNGKKVPAKMYLSSGTIPVIDQGQDFIGGYTDDPSLTIDPGEGLVVFGDHTRIFKRVDFLFAPGADGIKVLRPRLSGSKYAFYACRSLRFPNKGYSRHYSYLTRCKFPVAPEKEQDRIVSKIEELFSRIEEGERALQRVQKLVERYRQSVLKAAVTGELTREWRERHKGKLESGEVLLQRILKARREAWEKFELEKMKAKGQKSVNENWKKKYREPLPSDTTELPELPEGWVWASPVQLEAAIPNALTIGPFGSNLKVSDYTESGVPLIFVRNIRSQVFGGQGAKYVSASKAKELTSHIARANDILITKMGDPPGDACVYPEDAPDAVITADCIKWTLHPYLESREYFASLINSHIGRMQIAEITKGVAQQKVSLDRFRKIGIALPGKEEQAEIADRLRAELERLNSVECSLRQELRRASAMRQSILKTAYAGELVPQDPSDEPASVLIQRIADGRASTHVNERWISGKKRATV